jgi:hypothetical protein
MDATEQHSTGRADPAADSAHALGEQRTARRLLACAAAAILLGALSVLIAPPVAQAPTQPVAGAPDPRASADIKPKLDDRSLTENSPAQEALEAPEEAPVEAPLTAEEMVTPGGLQVVAFFPDAPLTVRERARLRADASVDADVIESVEPGRPLRVVGAVDVPRAQGGPWLQVRRGNGELAYVQAALAADLAGWRRQQIAERLRRQEAEAAAAAQASGIAVQPAPLPGDLLGGAPLSPPSFPDSQPFRPN